VSTPLANGIATLIFSIFGLLALLNAGDIFLGLNHAIP
jgi:hypothetical protein